MKFPIKLSLSGIVIILIFLISQSAIGSTDIQKGQITEYFDNISTQSKFLAYNGSSSELQSNSSKSADLFAYEKKSTVKAFFLSLAVPGLGEYYAGSRIKPFVFFGADVALWSGHIIYHNKGKDGERTYRAYADAHYIRDNYDLWWNTLDSTTQASYSHRLPPTNNYEYYENIGKYTQFVVGWDDYSPGDSITPHRSHYLDLRKQANDQFDTARAFMVVAMVNHVVSAFDAAFTAKSHYKKGGGNLWSDVRVRMVPRIMDNQVLAQLTFYKKF